MKKHTSVVLGLILVSVSGVSAAQDVSSLKEQTARALASGVPAQSLPVLQRKGARPGADVTRDLLARLCNGVCPTESVVAEATPDGSAAAFVNGLVERDLINGAPDEGGQWSADRLEKAGREYISTQLSDIVQLGPDETLVPLRVAYRRFGTEDANTGARTVKVITNEIVFGRTVKGVLIVGAGSKVRLGFSNAGDLHTLNYDWPVYTATSEQQKIAGAGVGLARLNRVLGVRVNKSLNPFSAAPAVAQFPWRASEGVEVHDYICGYVDQADGSAVQPACEYHALVKGDRVDMPLAGAVPMAETVNRSTTWPEAALLSGGPAPAAPPAPPTAPARP